MSRDLPEGYAVTGTLDAFTQLHVARKLAPAIPLLEGVLADRNAGKDSTVLAVLALAQLSDADTEYVMRKCLSVVVRQTPDAKPAKLLAADGTLMFQDTPMAVLLALTVTVIDEALGDFFRTALAPLNPAAGAVPAT